MNVQHELACVVAGLLDLGNGILDGEVPAGHAALRLADLAERVSDVAEHLRPERPRLRGVRRWWFRLTRRRIA